MNARASILVPEVCPPLGETFQDKLSQWIMTYHWDYFFTITNRKERRDSLAFIRDVKDSLQRIGGRKVFIACEPFRYSHNLHAHGLVTGEHAPAGWLPEYSLELPWSAWRHLFKRFGRSRVEYIRSARQVSEYCSKYVSKISAGDNWDFCDWTTKRMF